MPSGVTRIVDAGNLRHKESDRILSTARMLKSFGAKVETFDDAIVVHGGAPMHGAVIDSYNDHRHRHGGQCGGDVYRRGNHDTKQRMREQILPGFL